MPVQQLQRQTTASEFVQWQLYLQQAANQPKPEHYYLAQVAQEVAKVLSSNPQQIKLEHFLLKFTAGAAPPPAAPPTPEERAGRTAQSKQYWQAIMAAGKRKPPPQKAPKHGDGA